MLSKLKELFSYFLFKIGLKSTHRSGWTSFAPLKIRPEYTSIDLEKKIVTGVVKYNGKVFLTVIVDVKNDKTKVKGSLRGIAEVTKPFKKSSYIDIIKSDAESFIEKGITNPNECDDNH